MLMGYQDYFYAGLFSINNWNSNARYFCFQSIEQLNHHNTGIKTKSDQNRTVTTFNPNDSNA